MNAKILITGATGKVGRHLVRELQDRGRSLRAGVHSPEKAAFIAGRDTESVSLDFDRPETIAAALDGVDTVALLTPPDARQVDWAIRTIDLAQAAGVKRIVRLSVLAAAMEPGIQLGRWHRTVERYLEGSELEWSIVRPGPFMQNFLGMYPSGAEGFALPVGAAPVNHIHVADVARALAAVIATDGHSSSTYMVTGGGAQTLAEAAALLGKQYEAISAEQAKASFLAGGMPPWFVDVLLELFAAFGTGAVGLETSTFADLTGRKPISFGTFARELATGRAA